MVYKTMKMKNLKVLLFSLIIISIIAFFAVRMSCYKAHAQTQPTEGLVNLEQVLDDFQKILIENNQINTFRELTEEEIRYKRPKLRKIVESEYLLWDKSDLVSSFKKIGIYSPIDMGETILISLHRKLNNRPINLNGQIKFLKGDIDNENIKIEFKMVCTERFDNCYNMKEEGEDLYVEQEALLTASAFDMAYISFPDFSAFIDEHDKQLAKMANIEISEWEPYLTLILNSENKEKFGNATKENVGKNLAILVNDKFVVAPKIQQPILDGEIQVTGNLVESKMRSVAWQINHQNYLENKKNKR